MTKYKTNESIMFPKNFFVSGKVSTMAADFPDSHVLFDINDQIGFSAEVFNCN